MKIGGTTISDLKVGSAAVQKVYLGSQVVWMPAAGPVLPSDVLLYAPLSDNAGSTALAGYYKSGASHISEPALFTGLSGALTSAGQSKVTGAATSAYNPATSAASGFECDPTISNLTAVGSASPMSIEFWWYNSGSSSGTFPRIFSWGGFHDSGAGFEIEFGRTDRTNTQFFEYSTSGSVNRRDLGNIALTIGQWHHIYYAFDPSGPAYLATNGVINSFTQYLTEFSPNIETLSLGKTSTENDPSTQAYFQELIVRNSIPHTANFTPSTTPLL